MALELYQRVSLLRDVPEKNLKRGVVGTLVDYIPHPKDGEVGCVLEIFNVLGESIEVVVVSRSDIKELHENDFFSIQEISHKAVADIISFTVNHPEAMNGSVPLDNGILLFPSARDILMAGACAEIYPKASFPNRKPDRAVEYVKRSQLAQTSQGSYVVNLVSPLEIDRNSNKSEHTSASYEPFERRVVKRVLRAISALKIAVEQASSPENLQGFGNTIEEGVSSNLCKAILKMNEAGGKSGIKISFNWASELPITNEMPQEVILAPKLMPLIEAFVQKLETYAASDVEIRGKVITLQRSENGSTGQIVVRGYVKALEGKRSVKVNLSDKEYALATQAHDKRQTVACRGDLFKAGRYFELQNSRDFLVVS